MAHFFERRGRWGNGPALWVLVAMALLAPIALRALKTIQLKNDVENWLPHDDPQAVILRWYRDRFPIEDRVLISWDDNSLHDPRMELLKQKLEGTLNAAGEREGGVEFVEEVNGPLDVLERMQTGGVSTEGGLERLTGVLVGPGPIRVRFQDSLSDDTREQAKQALLTGLQQQFEQPITLVGPAVGAGEPLAARLEVEEQPAVDAAQLGDAENADAEAVANDELTPLRAYDVGVFWPGMHERPEELQAVREWIRRFQYQNQPVVADAFLQVGSPVALTAVLSPAAHGQTSEVLQAIREAAVEAGIPADQLRMGGRPVAGSELNQSVKTAGWNRDYPAWLLPRRSPLLMCGVVGIVLAFVMLRSGRLTFLVVVVALYTVMLAVALVPLTRGSMNMVLVVMPPLLSVLTLSAAIHLANYWKHAALADPQTAVVNACRTARTPCVLASLTTSIGLMSLMTSPLQPVEDFGYYAAIGCLISLTVVMYGLPAMLQFLPAKVPREDELDLRRWGKLADGLIRHWKLTAGLAVGLFVGSVIGLQHFRTETKVIRYFPDSARVVQDYNFLEGQLSGIVPVDVVVRFDSSQLQGKNELNFLQRAAIVRDVEAAIRTHPEISGSVSLADFLTIRKPLPANASTFQKVGAYRRAHETEQRILADMDGAAGRFLQIIKEPQTLQLGSGREMAVEAGDEVWRITAQVAVMSDLSYADLIGDFDHRADNPGELNVLVQSVLRRHPGTDHLVTGMVPLFLQTQQAVLDSLIVSFAAAFGLIGIVMIVLLRSIPAGLFTMIPNVLPVGVVFGMISWGGMPVDIGTMITASVALGIAIDGTLHLLTWFRNGIAAGRSRPEAIRRALMHCGPALWQTSAAVGLGLLMLSQAELLLVSRFGWLMAALIGAALVADVIVLPALLAGPLGAIIERSVLAEAAALNSLTESQSPSDDKYNGNARRPEAVGSTAGD